MKNLFFLLLAISSPIILSAQNCDKDDISCWKSKLEKGEKQLVGANLSGLDLTVYSSSKFDGLNLNFANLSGCNLAGIEFKNIQASSANFSGAKMEKVGFIGGSIEKCNFKDAILTGGYFNNCKVFESSFEHANLNAIDCRESTIKSCNFNEAALEKAVIIQTKVEGTDEAATTFNGSTMTECNWSKCALNNNVVFDGADLQSSRIDDCTANHVSFKGIDFDDVTITTSQFTTCIFDKANFQTTIFLSSQDAEHKLSFYTCSMKGVSFYDYPSEISRILFRYSDLTNANFSECDMYECDFLGATVFGADFSKGKKNKCNFEDVKKDKDTKGL